jgi:hypothetical protein
MSRPRLLRSPPCRSQSYGSSGEHRPGKDNVCSTADLQPGTVVHEADLKITAGGPVFEEVELVK